MADLTTGQKRAKTLKEKYGEDYFKHLGSRTNPNKGFGSATKEQRKAWAAKGGRANKRSVGGSHEQAQ